MINGIELDVSEWIGTDRVERNKEMNRIVDKIVDRRQNVKLVDMRNIVVSKDALINHDNRHFDRITYYRLAKQIAKNIGNDVKTRNFVLTETEYIAQLISKGIKRMIGY